MENQLPKAIDSLSAANEFITSIARCGNEAEIIESTSVVVRYFSLQVFGFVVVIQMEGREYHRYLIGCDPRPCYRYMKNKWYAIDPFLDYARHNTSPILADHVPSNSEGQKRFRIDAAKSGFRGGIAIPAHSSSSSLTGVLYLGTDKGSAQASKSLSLHRNLMRALAMELLEWCNARQFVVNMADLALDQLDIELLRLVRERTTTIEAAADLGITVSCAKKRYERLIKKLQASCKRSAMEKAIALGLIKPVH